VLTADRVLNLLKTLRAMGLFWSGEGWTASQHCEAVSILEPLPSLGSAVASLVLCFSSSRVISVSFLGSCTRGMRLAFVTCRDGRHDTSPSRVNASVAGMEN